MIDTHTESVTYDGGVIRRSFNGKYHLAYGSATACNHSGQRRPLSLSAVPVSRMSFDRASENMFCKKCFPDGKPSID